MAMSKRQASRLLCMALVACVSTGCNALDRFWGKEVIPEYCVDHPADIDCRNAFPDAAVDSDANMSPDAPIDADTCASNASCMVPTPVCDLDGSMKCVQCVAADQAACSGTTPTCGDDHVCRGCSKHDDCQLSNACLSDGSCAASADVAYVDPAGSGSGGACAATAPCNRISDALNTKRKYIKISGTLDEPVSINDQDVILLAAPDAILKRGNAGVVLKIDGTSKVQIFDLTIADGLGGTGIGISLPAGNSASLELRRVKLTNNAGGAISATGGTLTLVQSTLSGNAGGAISATGGTLSVQQSTLSGNAGGAISSTGGELSVQRSTLDNNAGGGISISGSEFDIVNNIITRNGSGSTAFGGVRIDGITASGRHVLEFNTITVNLGPPLVHTGIACGTILVPLMFSSNIIYNNVVSGGGLQIGGSANCSVAYSDVGPSASLFPGLGNIKDDPLFVSPQDSNFHLRGDSPAKDTANPEAALPDDIEGDVRPQGSRRDMGADEVRQ